MLMIDNNNILLISDNIDIANSVKQKLVLLRENDNITVCDFKGIKKNLENSLYSVVVLHEMEDSASTLKTISQIKAMKPDAELMLMLNDTNEQLVLDAYDKGIYDYFLYDAEAYEMVIKTINCIKMRLQKDIQARNEKFLYQLGVIDTKTNLYQYKYLKEIFIEISDNLRIQNGVFAIITLDDRNKTKISINRLANTIKTSVRGDDIIAIARGGKIYLIMPNIDLSGSKKLIEKIQNKMGNDFQVRAGLAKVGIQSFETLDKYAQDGLISAIQNDSIAVCLQDNIECQDGWLNDDEETKTNKHKSFKLFKIIYTNKMNSVITPLFYRYQKDFENSLTNTNVSQYSNNVESVFCLKNDSIRSELIIRYDGYAKFNVEIIHSGLDSPENSKFETPLSKMTEKYLSTLLKQLKSEYKQYQEIGD